MAVPDASINPHATGPALKIVEAHSAPQDLVFYAGWCASPPLLPAHKSHIFTLRFCPFVQRFVSPTKGSG